MIPQAAKSLAALLLSSCCIAAVAAPAATCSAVSGERRVAVLELYTSEGCNSCPPTDQWVSMLPSKGFGPDRLIPLALHVDYWNHLGWKDPFSKGQYSERQRWMSQINQAGFVYTPQVVLNGRDYRRGLVWDNLSNRVDVINREKPGADIRLSGTSGNGAFEVAAASQLRTGAERKSTQLYLALYENDLSNDVRAGENSGKKLHHDFVVRELAGPFGFDASGAAKVAQRFPVPENWKKKDLVTVAFVQDSANGEVLQALALPVCN
ncbi:MAG: DUF1223 domain-containing protein [Betaproteobacteria bacterium]|nr:DUF1223 domain-containing protein [Betaproteobacteria bacterium]